MICEVNRQLKASKDPKNEMAKTLGSHTAVKEKGREIQPRISKDLQVYCSINLARKLKTI